jgi:hypothetical protein
MKLRPGVEIQHNRQKYAGEIPDRIVSEIEANIGEEKLFKAWKKKVGFDAKRDEPKEKEPVKDDVAASGS